MGSQAGNEGQRRFAAIPGTLATIAERIGGGTSKARVCEWRNGSRFPTAASRALIEAAYPSIPASSWGMAPTEGAGAAEEPVDEGEGSDPDPGGSVRDPRTPLERARAEVASRQARGPSKPASRARTLIEQAEEQLAQAIKDIAAPGVLLTERTRARREVVTMMRDIDRMKRAEESLEADVVKRAPFFRAATRELLAALKNFPDAARAVAERFAALEARDDARPVQGALDEEDEER